MGKLTISMAMFNSFLYVYQRVRNMIQQQHDACHCLPWFALAEAVMEQQNTVTNKKVHFLEYQPSSSKLFFLSCNIMQTCLLLSSPRSFYNKSCIA